MSRRIYLAGSSREIETVERYRDKLIAAGWTITHDWCSAMRACPVPDSQLTPEQRMRYATDDAAGVIAADVLWLLVPQAPSKGAWVELGIAIGHAAALGLFPMVIASGGGDASIFNGYAYRMDSHDEACELLCGPMDPSLAVPTADLIVAGLNLLARSAHEAAVAKGFYRGEPAPVAWGAFRDRTVAERRAIVEKLALISTEVSEAVEALRRPECSPAALWFELADIVIRTADLAGWLGIDFGKVVVDKMRRNARRGQRHGKDF